jgi:lipoprotein-anchoring transpeptidase ErfK/SrfK
MRRFFLLLLVALLGAGSYIVYHHLTKPPAEPVAEAPVEESAAGQPGLLPGPILSDEIPVPAAGKEADIRPPTPAIEPPAPSPVAPVVTTVPPPAPPTPAPPSEAGDLDSKIRRAQAAFTAGDLSLGKRLLQEVFEAGKDRADGSIVAQVRQLIEIEERSGAAAQGAGSALRLNLYRYIEARDTDPAWRQRASLALGAADLGAAEPQALESAWARLTTAYLEAPSAAERTKALASLKPFVEKHIFSRRFSPLIDTYTVKAGDSVNKIAKLKGTTEEAVGRLNGLKNAIIQPGQRLIVLKGKLKVYVKKSEFRMWVTVGDRLLGEWPVGLGRENSTPATTFTIAVRQKDPIWYKPGEVIPAGDPRNILGTRWLGFKNTDDLKGFGIHGTSDPASIGKEVSSGCIRLRNEDLEVLWDLIPAGTEVEVRE